MATAGTHPPPSGWEGISANGNMTWVDASATSEQDQLLDLARGGDTEAFDRLVAPYRRELHAHCYRMLGSVHDADDALQEALLGAWRGLSGFEGRSSLRAWLYRIATHASMKVGGRRPKRQLSLDYAPATDPAHDLGDPVMEPIWLEPYPESMLSGAQGTIDPAARYEVRESVELAFVAALQHLPATQRAVLILREVLAFPATEVASLLDSTVASVNSALQRARSSLEQRVDGPSQQSTLRTLGESGRRELVEKFVSAWERADVPALLGLLVDDARFSMPPLPAWFDGPDDIGRFMSERMFATSWRLVPIGANGQLAFGCYQAATDGSPYRLSAINVLTLRGSQIAEITAFLDPADHDQFGLPAELAS